MASKSIIKYMASWDFEDHLGRLNLGFEEDGKMDWQIISIADPQEYAILLDLLRNESPIYLVGTRLQTSHKELTGEGDG